MSYEDRSYHQLSRMYRGLADKDKREVSVRINNYYRTMVERSMKHLHPNLSEPELKAAVFERIYRDDFPADEMARIRAAMIAFHNR